MKINDIKTNRLSGSKSGKKTKSTGSTDFFGLLRDHISSAHETTQAAPAEHISETANIPAQLRFQGISLSEETINLLEAYCKALANLNLDTEALAPIVEAMEGETTALLDIKEQLDDSDPLAQLIDQITTISYIEAEKYRRGDYGN